MEMIMKTRNTRSTRLLRVAGILLAFFLCSTLTLCKTNRGALGGLSYSPGGNGFGYKAVSVPRQDFNKWVYQNKKKIKQTLSSIEKGYVLEVVGHTDSSGPRHASGSRRGNIWYSTQRAKSVYNAMLRQGFSRSKLRYKGIADDELLDSSDDRASINRRVSFRVVAK